MKNRNKIFVLVVSFILILSLTISVSASTSSPSGAFSLIPLLNYVEVSNDMGSYITSDYISIYNNTSLLKGTGSFFFYGNDLEPNPPNYSYTRINLILSGIATWTGVDDNLLRYNDLTLNFGVLGSGGQVYRSSSYTMYQDNINNNIRFSISIILSMEEWQQIGYGINGFVIGFNLPVYATQAIIRSPSLAYRYSSADVVPAPLPSPTVLPDAVFPTVPPLQLPDILNTPRPTVPTIDESLWESAYIGSLFFNNVLQEIFLIDAISGVVTFSLICGMLGTIVGFSISYFKNRGD